MEDGPPMFRQGFSCLALLVFTLIRFRVRGYHPVSPDFPDCSTNTPQLTLTGLFPFRSPLLRESRLISIPPVTEMFQFTGFAFHTYEFSVK